MNSSAIAYTYQSDFIESESLFSTYLLLFWLFIVAASTIFPTSPFIPELIKFYYPLSAFVPSLLFSTCFDQK